MPETTRIKICGITSIDEIYWLNHFCPDYAGFVFTESRRQVNPEFAAKLGKELALSIKRVGVFVDLEPVRAAKISEMTGLDVIQLHGREDSFYIDQLRSIIRPGIEIWKALRVDAVHMPDESVIRSMHMDRLLLDTYVDGVPGGTGRCFDWKLVSQMDIKLPIILAGGLHPGNVKDAIQQASPFAVDTSSGVESGGRKDKEKLQAFIEAIKSS